MTAHTGPAVRSVVDAARPIGLPEVLERAELQERTDTKYLLDAAAFGRWAARLSADLDVLEIDARREFRYESTYFDTPDRALFRAHRQGRRRRYKVRTRSYLDTGTCQLEVKFESGRDVTVKERTGHPFGERHRLTPPAVRHVAAVLAEQLRAPLPDLAPALTNNYDRCTLLLRDAPVRITCDVGLRWTGGHSTFTAPGQYVLVEVKAARPRNPATAAFSRIGVRPVSISKYCAGIALLEPWRPANPWRPVIQRYLIDGAPMSSRAPAGRYRQEPDRETVRTQQ